MTPEEEIMRAQYAKEVLENPLILEALETYERKVTELWQQTTLNGADVPQTLLKIRMMLEPARNFKKFMEQTIQTGKMAKLVLQQKQTMLERAKSVISRR